MTFDCSISFVLSSINCYSRDRRMCFIFFLIQPFLKYDTDASIRRASNIHSGRERVTNEFVLFILYRVKFNSASRFTSSSGSNYCARVNIYLSVIDLLRERWKVRRE